jgi:hypothetical protein
VQAQDSALSQPQLILDGLRPTDLDWSSQEPILAFSDASLPSGSVINDFETWYRFNPSNGNILNGNIWPLQPAIPRQIESQVIPGTLMFPSPNGRYLIFVAPNTSLASFFETELKVFDTVQNIVMDIGVPGGGITRSVGFLNVIWGTDTEFVVSTHPEEGGLTHLLYLHYVTIENNSITARLITDIDYEGQILIIVKLFDVAEDGSHALIHAGFLGEFQPFLAVWNLESPDESIHILDTQINLETLLDARFTTVDGSRFIFADDQRLGHFNVTTETSTTISDSINGQRYRFAEFSSTGEQLALADDTAVYWLDLHSAFNVIANLPSN